jgi:tripartite ATP-independent transporter DctM subunit
MDIGLISLLMVIAVLTLIFLGVPIAFCLITTSLIFTIAFWGFDKVTVLATSTFGNMINPTYLAVPLFVFMACVLQFSGLTDDLFEAIWKWLGGVRGGLAIASVIAITILSAMTGIGATGIFTIGMIAYPQMTKRGYDQSIAIGPIPPASALGPLIPPSNIMIILGGFASLSIGALFMGGFIPGFMISASFIIYILIKCARNPKLAPVIPLEERPSLKEKLIAARGVAMPIVLVILVLGGIWTGVTTAIEGAGAGAMGALICAMIKRKLNLEKLKTAVVSTLQANVMVMWLLIGGSCYSAFMSASGMATYLSNMLMNLPLPPFGILSLLMIILLILGCFMDSVAIIMITVPVFFPIAKALNFDPIWFGVLFTIAIIIGYVTPPFGYNLFYMRGILPPEISTRVIFRTVLPYVPMMILVLFICMLFPQLVMFLPNILIG